MRDSESLTVGLALAHLDHMLCHDLEGVIMTRDQLQILENQLVAHCQYKGVQTTLHKLLESLYEGKTLDQILAEMLE